MDAIKVDPEFRALIPPLRAEERQQLEANIVAEGCRDPLVVWRSGRILLDGHNRHEICSSKAIPFKIVELDFPHREAAADWIDANQLGRRNLTPDQYSLLRGRRYNRTKRQGERTDKTSDHFEQKSTDTAERLAKQHGVSRPTIVRDGQFAAAVEKVKTVDPKIESKVVQGTAPTKGAVVEAAKVIAKAEAEVKAVAATPLIPTRKDKEAAAILDKAKDKAAAILSGDMGTIAQAKREVARQEKREALEIKAKEAEADPERLESRWEIRVGDCLELLRGEFDRKTDEWTGTISLASVRLIFADPPYNIGIDYGDHYDDNMAADVFEQWSRDWIEASIEHLSPDGSMWVLINDEWADVFGIILRDLGLHRRSWIKWHESFGVNTSNNFNRCSRHLFYCVKDPKNFVFNPDAVSRPSDRQAKYGDSRADPGGKIWDNVWGINPAIPRLVENARERLPDFPTQLPLSLLLPIVGCASDPGDLVLDPFNGSGTTGEACIRLGRRYLGIEKSEKFAALARLRLTAAKEDRSEVAC